jgi:hypothetical protein
MSASGHEQTKSHVCPRRAFVEAADVAFEHLGQLISKLVA